MNGLETTGAKRLRITQVNLDWARAFPRNKTFANPLPYLGIVLTYSVKAYSSYTVSIVAT